MMTHSGFIGVYMELLSSLLVIMTPEIDLSSRDGSGYYSSLDGLSLWLIVP